MPHPFSQGLRLSLPATAHSRRNPLPSLLPHSATLKLSAENCLLPTENCIPVPASLSSAALRSALLHWPPFGQPRTAVRQAYTTFSMVTKLASSVQVGGGVSPSPMRKSRHLPFCITSSVVLSCSCQPGGIAGLAALVQPLQGHAFAGAGCPCSAPLSRQAGTRQCSTRSFCNLSRMTYSGFPPRKADGAFSSTARPARA